VFGVAWGSLDECVVPRAGTRALVNQVIAGEVRVFGPGYVHDVTRAADVIGGYAAWAAAGLPTARPEECAAAIAPGASRAVA
jgi:hypothetical protein